MAAGFTYYEKRAPLIEDRLFVVHGHCEYVLLDTLRNVMTINSFTRFTVCLSCMTLSPDFNRATERSDCPDKRAHELS